MLYGIAAIANSHVFVAGAHDVIGDLRAWGWVTLIISVLQLVAAGGVLMGNQLARWFAVAVVGLNAIEMMFFIRPIRSGRWSSSPRTCRAVGAVRLRQPRKPGSRLAPQCPDRSRLGWALPWGGTGSPVHAG